MTLVYAYALFFFIQHHAPQMVPNPRFFHERFSLSTHFRLVTKEFGETRPQTSEAFTNPFLQKRKDVISVFYRDTIFQRPCGVGLSFSKGDSLLESIVVTFLGVDPAIPKPLASDAGGMDALWDSLSTHLGKPDKESKIPFAGKKRVWRFPSVEVELLQLTGAVPILALSYSRPD